jgi:site-specific DNA-methyltransferase (adenine-specific)
LPAGDDAKKWEGWGTNLKPALEPITVARKPLSEKSVAENVLKWGTGGINIDECRVDFVSDEDKKDACSERPNFKNHNENRIVFDSMNGKGNEKRGNPN